MKKLVFMCIATIIVTKLYAQTSGYWYKTEYISLNPIPDSTQLVISDNSVYSRNNQKYEHRLHKVTFNKAPKEMGQLKKDSYVSCLYKDSRGYTTYVLPMVCVGTENETAIKEIIEKYKGFLNLESQIGSAYYLSGPFNNAEEVLQMVCEVSDMDGVIWCQPDMTTNAGTTNDYYSEQWYLNGTNSFGINVEPAWNIVQVNSDIVVAVIDDGVDYLGTLKHEDLADYVIEGYTVGDINSKGNPKNDNLFDKKAHGIACTGIIAASDNTIGIKGIASGVKILPVNIFPNTSHDIHSKGDPISTYQLAQAIYWAGQRADILSCSWYDLRDNDANVPNAIEHIIQNGRNGKGCVVVFSSGNFYQQGHHDVGFPANVDGVISVGAINEDGTMWGATQRGSRLDVVAPGWNICTLDRMGSEGDYPGNYNEYFIGTSAACPQVAGIAALMLSANSNLTSSEVRSLLKSTARYMSINGGYGLVDAFAAVKAARPSISGPTMMCTLETYEVGIPADMSVALNTSNSPGGFSIKTNSKLSIISYSNGILTVQKVSAGQGRIEVYYNGHLANSLDVWVGGPVITDLQYIGGCFYTESPIEGEPFKFHWVVGGQSYWGREGRKHVLLQNGTYDVEAYAENISCGRGPSYYKQIVVSDSRFYALGNITDDHQVTVNAIDYSDSPQPKKSRRNVGAKNCTVPYSLANTQTGEVVARGEMPSQGGVLDFSHLRSGLYALTLSPAQSKAEVFKITLE